MFEINRYLNGQKHGFQLLYDLNTSLRPKFMEFYHHGTRIWSMFPSADVDYTLSEGRFLKGVILNVDSAFVRAPFDSTLVWYEGAFVRTAGTTVPIGVHRIFNEKGELTIEALYHNSREPIRPKKHPQRIIRMVD